MTDMENKVLPPCEHCGKVFSEKTPKHARESHVMACERKMAMKQAMSADTEAEVDSESQVEKDKRRAKAVAEVRRKQAPKIQVNPMSEPDPLRELERYVKEMELCAPDAHIYFGDMTKHEMNVNKGYSPITDGGQHLGYGDVRMYEIPDEVYKAEIHRNAAISNNAIYSQVAEAEQTQAEKDADMASAIDAAVEKAMRARIPA